MGAPLNAGFLAGRERFNYWGLLPKEAVAKRSQMSEIAREHDVDLRTAALQFAAAPDVVSAIVPGSRTATQARQNAESMRVAISAEFWAQMRRERLVSEQAPIPA